jgi:hypothetical protein
MTKVYICIFPPSCVLKPMIIEDYAELCTISVDVRDYVRTLKPEHGTFGLYFDVALDIVMTFGTTEFKAEAVWVENVCSSSPSFSFVLTWWCLKRVL